MGSSDLRVPDSAELVRSRRLFLDRSRPGLARRRLRLSRGRPGFRRGRLAFLPALTPYESGLPAALVALADLDAPRLGLLPYGDREVQDAVAVVGLDGVDVQALAEDQLTAEPSLRALRDEDLRPIVRRRARVAAVTLGLPEAALPPRRDGKGVALDV